jgi:hemoglobin
MQIVRGLGLLLLGAALLTAPAMAAAPKKAAPKKAAPAADKPATPAGPSLYQRLGEEPGIAHLVDAFVGKVATDKRVNGRFKKSNIPKLKQRFVALIAQLGGGPQKYGPVDLHRTHAGMGCTAGEFNAIVEDFVWAENKVHIDKWSQKQLNKALGGTRGQIVQVEKNTYPTMGADAKTSKTSKASGKSAAKKSSKPSH